MRARIERTPFLFLDRRDAGLQLRHALVRERADDAVVVGLAKGGIVVAAAVASALKLPLDAVAIRKVRHPLQPEYALGAVSPSGDVLVQNDVALTVEELALAVADAEAAASTLEQKLHSGRPAIALQGREALLVDDGFATGASMVAAIRWARKQRARSVVAAAPIGSTETIELLLELADRVVCPHAVDKLIAVGIWYANFAPVSDEDVVELLASSGRSETDPLEAASLPRRLLRTG